ncbi:MAG: oxidoreductase [Phycisphaerae bacterium]
MAANGYTMIMLLYFVALSLLALSGLPGLFLDRRTLTGQRIAAGMMLLGALVGLSAVMAAHGAVRIPGVDWAWALPVGRFAMRLDGLTVFFLVPVLLVPALGAVYGLAYWRQDEHAGNGRKLRFFYGLLAAAMAVVVGARDGIVLLVAWEIMALAAFFLVTTEDEDTGVRQAGWVYLVATHLGTLCLIAVFALLGSASGSFDLVALEAGVVGGGPATAIFLLALVGFGLKAGLMPLHVWLPGAHANAPSHVSALLSGVMIKMGVYGIVRIVSLLPDPPIWWGGLVLTAGAVSGVLGVVFALAQHDLKRLLAYHSIENIGIIAMGLGLAMIGRSMGRPDWVVLGLAGSLLHVWNHGLFKSLLFLSAGSVIHAAGTREIDDMGGLSKRMPYTSLLFLIGAVAICGLPPLNGFVSELLVYLGLFRTVGIGAGPSWPAAAFAVPALAMIGALAVACFVKVFGAVFLGAPRCEIGARSHESPVSMLAPMGLLAMACAVIGLAPESVAPLLDRAVRAWMPATALPGVASLVPLGWIGGLAWVLLIPAVLGTVLLWRLMQRGAFQKVGTWDCGYAAPSARMQYTASSFAQILVGLFSWILRPQQHRPGVKGIFPEESRFESHVDDTVLDSGVLPCVRLAERGLLRLRFLQQGRIQLYVLYLLVAVVVLLVIVSSAGGAP